MKLVGLVGRARSGKDTVADFMSMTGDFNKMAFAEPLKNAACHIFGLTHEQVNGDEYDREEGHPFWGFSVRTILQKLGTESVRDVFGADHWVRLMEKRLHDAEDKVVISDVRFPNEVDLIKRFGGTVVGVVREGYDHGFPEHPSEYMAAYDLDEVSDTVFTARTVGELEALTEEFLHE